MKIHCEFCKSEFIPKHKGARFCSNDCHNNLQKSKKDLKEVICKSCGTKFNAKLDHGVRQKFCSRNCFEANSPIPVPKECPECGCTFIATRSSNTLKNTGDGLVIFCSKKCYHASQRKTKIELRCACCGDIFFVSPRRQDEKVCSIKCRAKYYSRELSVAWKGGFYFHSQTGEKQVLVVREGFVGKYMGENRFVAMQEIKRPLTRKEVVIRVNNTLNDNRPENLYICESMSVAKKILSGKNNWPKESNLIEYKVGN